MRWRHLAVAFVASTALANDVDEEIIQHLEFFERLPVIEEMDLVEMADDTKIAQTSTDEEPGQGEEKQE